MGMIGYEVERKKSRIIRSICLEQPGARRVVSFTVGRRLGALVWIILKPEPSQSLFGRWSQKTGARDSDKGCVIGPLLG